MNRLFFKKWVYRHLIPRAALPLVRLLSATCRIRMLNQASEQALLDSNDGPLYASWHQRFFPGITFFSSRRPIAIIISRSRDGEMIARIVQSLGWHPVRGSSTRGGKKALETIKHLGKQGYRVGHIVDGPQGPFGVVKPGLIRIAQYTGLPILPTITSAERRWVFNSWDRFMVPKPFSRILIRFGDPIHVPDTLNPKEFETVRRRTEERLHQLYAETDRIWENPEQVRRLFC